MDDRIKIGDVWYVKEDKTAKVEKHEIMYSKEMQIDVNEYSLVASIMVNEDFGDATMPTIDVKSIDHKTLIECMDNDEFLLGVANRSEISLKEFEDTRYEINVISAIVELCDQMKKKDWI